MAGRKRNEIIAALCKKGFTQLEGAKHLKLLHIGEDGFRTGIYTVFSRGAADLSDKTLAGIARQLRLTSAEFRRFVDCEVSASGYLEILRKKGFPV